MGLIRILLIALSVWLLYRLIRRYLGDGQGGPRHAKTSHAPREPNAAPAIEELVQDPQCQTYLPKNEAVRARVDGQELFFCCEKCRDQYLIARGAKK